jgi:RHS repeat-associated protein
MPTTAGNLLSDGLGHNFTYDAENRILTAAGVTYTYDGDGKRVEKSTGTLYWTGAGTDALSESDLSGNINAEYIFFNGKRVARVDRPSLVVHHFLTDHLSSSRMSWTGTTDANRAIEQDIDYTPYGITVGAAPVDHYEFTGKERDSESGVDYSDARHYTSIMGRFLQPDPAGLLAADPSNPQSWNRYAYALNNPLSFIDPSGMLLCDYGPSDYGGEDFEDADDDNDCTDHGGTPATDQTTITVSADNPDDVVTTENGHQIFPANNGNLTPAQCQAARTLLTREAQHGTTIAAFQSAIGFGDNTVQPFNSSNTAPINTPVGSVKIDWYTDIQATGPSFSFGVGNSIAYAEGKLVWTGLRLAFEAPITNYLPFTDATERNTLQQTFSPFSHYSDILTPAFMQENCK